MNTAIPIFTELTSNEETIYTLKFTYDDFQYKNKCNEDINSALRKGKVFDSGCIKLQSFGVITQQQTTKIMKNLVSCVSAAATQRTEQKRQRWC